MLGVTKVSQERIMYGQKSRYQKRGKEKTAKNVKRETACEKNEESRPAPIRGYYLII
jgi:hypothetical protein